MEDSVPPELSKKILADIDRAISGFRDAVHRSRLRRLKRSRKYGQQRLARSARPTPRLSMLRSCKVPHASLSFTLCVVVRRNEAPLAYCSFYCTNAGFVSQALDYFLCKYRTRGEFVCGDGLEFFFTP